MPRISSQEFKRLPLRAHDFLAGIPLHDAWAVDLPRAREAITLDRFLDATSDRVLTPSPLVRLLLRLRFLAGAVFGWDADKTGAEPKTFASRLTPSDRAKSKIEPGTQRGPFRVVYRFENEEVTEIINATVHAAAVIALVETPAAYRYYLGVYVDPVSRWTPLYMASIDPVRRFFVYPSLLRSVRSNWSRAFMRV